MGVSRETASRTTRDTVRAAFAASALENPARSGPLKHSVGIAPNSSAETTPEPVSAATPRQHLHFARSLPPNSTSSVFSCLPKYTLAKPSWRPVLVLQDRDIDFFKAVSDYRLL